MQQLWQFDFTDRFGSQFSKFTGKTNLEIYDWFKILLELVGILQLMQEHWWIYVGLGIRGFIRFWLKIQTQKW